jgi:glutamate synthase (NADPH/NADH) small chain
MRKTPVEIRDDGVVFAHNELGEDGEFHPVPGSEQLYPCTGVIVSVSQEMESNLLNIKGGIHTEQSGLLDVDEEGHTTRAGVFAAGDAAHGARTVVEAVVTGKRVAEAMHAYMQSLPLPEPSPYANVPTHTEQAAAAQAEQVFY